MGFSWGDLLGTVSTGFDIYSGINAMNTAENMYDIAAGSADQQDKIAEAQWGISQPVAQKEAEVAQKEAQTYLDDISAKSQNADWEYYLKNKEYSLLNEYGPQLQKQSYLNDLQDLNAYAGLQDPQYQNELAGLGLNANIINTQQQNLDLYNQYNPDLMAGQYQNAINGESYNANVLNTQQENLDLYNKYNPDLVSVQYQNALTGEGYNANLLSSKQNDLDIYNQYNPDLLTGQYQNAIDGTEYNANVLDAHQLDLDLYNQSRGMVEDYYQQAQEGLDINDQMSLAKADVAQAFANTQKANNMQMARMGVNPNSGKYADQSRLNATNQALATAFAGTSARRNAEETNFNRLAGAVKMRNGTPSAAGTNMSTPSVGATNTNVASPNLVTANTSVTPPTMGGYNSSFSKPTTTGLQGISASSGFQPSAMNGTSTMANAGSLYGSSANTMANLGSTAANAAGTSFYSAGQGLNTMAKNAGADSWLNQSIF